MIWKWVGRYVGIAGWLAGPGLTGSSELLNRGYEGIHRLPCCPVTYYGAEELAMCGIRRIV